MSIVALHADARADAHAAARSDLLERRLARFQPQVRARVCAVAEQHPRLKDLALSFPALLFALAVPRAGYDRALAVARVIEGASLRELAAITGVPLWLRRFAPEGFGAALPLLPDGDFFRRQIGNYAPRSPNRIQPWLQIVSDAALWGDDAVAIWIAREAKTRAAKFHGLRRVCLWAWYSRHVGIQSPDIGWSLSLNYDAAASAAAWWRERLAFRFKNSGPRLRDSWLQPGHFLGYEFVALDTLDEITAEGVAMRNCVSGYTAKVLRNQCRLWSVRQQGKRVATLELALPWDGPLPHVAQLKTIGNNAAPTEIWWAARAWLGAQDLERLDPAMHGRRRMPIDKALWLAHWKPYWMAKQRIPSWLPLTPTFAALNEP